MSVYTFEPVYHEKIWGGRHLHEIYGRDLPEGVKIGESWELVDRGGRDCSKLVEPAGAHHTLHDLWVKDRQTVFGRRAPDSEHFPILIKLLDAADKLSVQVHPPAALAKELGGEPKTEMWYFLGTETGAEIYVGLKKGVTREQFEQAIGKPGLADLLHTLPTQPGESVFLPSGRVHAIGGGNLIFEVQQNSDTTYRVDDWHRVDDDGKPRELHIEESLRSINFHDFEPTFAQPHGEKVVECAYFTVSHQMMLSDEFRSWRADGQSFHYHFVTQGEVEIDERRFKTGDAFLVSADHGNYELVPGEEGAEVLSVTWGR